MSPDDLIQKDPKELRTSSWTSTAINYELWAPYSCLMYSAVRNKLKLTKEMTIIFFSIILIYKNFQII